MAMRGTSDDTIDAKFLTEIYKQPKFPYSLLRDQSNRTKTFYDKSWRDTEIAKVDYAKAGFYFTGDGDMIKCPFCYLELKNMKNPKKEMGKMLLLLHAWLSGGRCKFIAGDIMSRSEDVYKDGPSAPVRGMDQESDDWPRLGFETSPKHPVIPISEGTIQQTYSLQNYNDRLRTYVNFPQTARPTVQSLAKAGFFCNPNSSAPDKVTCFWCDGSLEGWKPTDVPWEEHAKYYPGCNYLRKTKGTNYILRTRKAMTATEKANARHLRYHGSGTILSLGYGAYNDVTIRRQSFAHRNYTKEFSRMGFYEVADHFMQCYACGLTLSQNITPFDARDIHRKESEDCEMMNVDPAYPSEGPEGVMLVTQIQLYPCGCVLPDRITGFVAQCPHAGCGQPVQWYSPLQYNRGNP